MLLTRRKQRSKTLLQDVGRAAGRIADESRSVAGTARSELGGLSTEIRDQATDTLTQARLATAAKLAGAAQTIQPERKRHRRLRFLIPAVAGGFIAAKIAKMRRERADTDELAESPSDSEVAPTTAASSEAVPSASKPAGDGGNGKSRAAKQSAARSGNTGS